MAYDARRDRVVVFGGSTESILDLDDTWEWDGSRWLELHPVTRPRPPIAPFLLAAYDARTGRVVMVVGSLNVTPTPLETWEWDGVDWTRKTPVHTPTPRRSFSLAADPVRGRVVLFGGSTGSTSLIYLDDTWEWDGVDWTLRSPVTRPAGRQGAALAFDERRGRVVLIGGPGDINGNIWTVWEWDGVDWQGHGTDGFWIAARTDLALAFHPAAGGVVLFGGVTRSSSESIVRGDTLVWNGGYALPQITTAPQPLARYGARMVYDAARRQCVLFGGGYDDLWAFEGSHWRLLRPGTPGAITRHAMAHDSVRGRTVLFGGEGTAAQVRVWESNGAAWERRGTQLAARTQPAMAFDAARGRTVLCGGFSGATVYSETREWDGTSWELRDAATLPPRYAHAMAYDPERRVTVLFGGFQAGNVPLDDTWEWNGTTWLRRVATGRTPPARGSHALAYDVLRRRTVLFGGAQGGQALGDTWEWDGATWIEQFPAASPPPRSAHAAAYDHARARVVVFGGADNAGVLSDHWEWDGAAWSQRAVSAPVARHGHALVYDANARRLVLCGGTTSAGAALAETAFCTPDTPAYVVAYGIGCMGSNGVPELGEVIGRGPWLPGDFQLRLQNLPPGGGSALAFGTSNRLWYGSPLPLDLGFLGMSTCTLLASPDVLVPIGNGSGETTWTATLGAFPSLVGQKFYAQALVADPIANPFGLTLTNGAMCSLGAR